MSEKPMDRKTGRNDPCFCGSGRKYRHCHGASTPILNRPVPLWVLLAVAALAATGPIALLRISRQPAPAPGVTSPLGGLAGTPTPGTGLLPEVSGNKDPAPFFYDSTRKQYWDPSHRHWHNGLPPAQLPSPAVAAANPPSPPNAPPVPEPAPYFYNDSTGHYWDPRHKHWHRGKPNVDSLMRVDSLLPANSARTGSGAPGVPPPGLVPSPARPRASPPDTTNN